MNLKVDLANANKEMLSEVQRQAESYMAAQLQTAVAADGRALSFVSLMAAATAALGGGGVALLIADHPTAHLGWLGLGMALGFVISMGLAVWSAKPSDFWYVGSRPSNWAEDARAGKPLETAISEQLKDYDERIGINAGILERNAKRMTRALWTAFATLVIGGVAGAALIILHIQ